MVGPEYINNIDAAEAESMGLVETIKNSVQPESVAHKFGVDKNLLIDIGVYGSIGFIIGYLLRKYSEYVITLALLLAGIIVLQQFEYLSLSLNCLKIQKALGLPEYPMTSDAYGNLLWEWVRIHPVSASSMGIGFLIGIKVG